MTVLPDLKRHPVAMVTYVIYLLMWAFFVTAIISISRKQEESGMMYCGTGVMLTYYMMLVLSSVYLILTFSFALFTSNKRFFFNMTFAIVLPIILAFLWQFVW